MKKVLIVVYHFPPMPPPGAIRMSKIAKYLDNYGWEAHVLTVNSAPTTMHAECELSEHKVTRVGLDESLKGQKSTQKKGKNQNIENNGKLSEKLGLNWLKKVIRKHILPRPSSLMLPDKSRTWCFAAIQAGRELLRDERFDAILSSYPTPSSHIVASQLAKDFHVSWVADYRDLWTGNKYLVNPNQYGLFWEKLNKIVEKRAIKRASHLIVVSSPLAEELRQLHGKPVTVIPNGYDPTDYPENSENGNDKVFSIGYAGHLNSRFNDPEPLLKAIWTLIKDGVISRKEIRLRFLGRSFGNIQELGEKHGLMDIIECLPPVSYQESHVFMSNQTVLAYFQFVIDHSEGVYSSKIFTYIGSSRPILVIGKKPLIVSELIHRTGTGLVADSVKECQQILQAWITEWRENGKINMESDEDEEETEKYSRQYQAGQFAEILNSVVEKV